MKQTLLFVFLLLSVGAWAQQAQGVVTYERVEHWPRIISRLTFMSNEEKDRIKQTWGSTDEGWKQKMKLVFTPTQSLYVYGEAENTDGGYSWRRSEYAVARNFEKETKAELLEMLGRVYVLEDSLKAPNWKIMNQLKDIAGHVCMKAVTEDPIRNQKITAWFAQDIESLAGPEQYFGLPGLILELDINEGDVVVTATDVQLREVGKEAAVPKMKGKKIKQADHDALITAHIRDSVKAYRNPFWALRY
jgi:GLPGLI family protein